MAKRIRVDPARNGVQVIAVSGYWSPEDRARALTAGFDEHLVKPIEFDRLMSTIEQPDGVR